MYRNSDMQAAIDEYVHVTWQREALRLRFCEGLTYEEIGGRLGYSTQYIKEIIRKHRDILFANV
jgi:DNA-directed RNA polymerase specialized sigma24 family protein